MKKTSIISALLLAPALFAEEPQSPIVHTESGPCSVFTETRVFVNGKELTPQEVEQFKKLGAAAYLKNKVQPVQAPAPAPAPKPGVFINGHELPADVAKSLIDNGVLPLLQAPVQKAHPTPPAEEATIARPQHGKVIRPKHGKVIRPDFVPVVRPKPTRPDCHCKPVCQCIPTLGKPSCCAPAPAPKPCHCKPEHKCGPAVDPDCQPAEPNTPVLPTPALDANPAATPAPACPPPCRLRPKLSSTAKKFRYL